MDPNATSSGRSRHRRDRTNRRQYQSCDRCRKGRRGCDAVTLGIDPFGRTNPSTSNQTRRRGCSGCQKFNKECTFEWLRSVPRKLLPLRLTTNSGLSEPRFRDQPGFDTAFASADLWLTHNAPEPAETVTGTIFHDELDLDLGLDGLAFPGDGLPLAVNYQLGSISQPPPSGPFFGAAYDVISSDPFDQGDFSRDQFHSAEPTGKSSNPEHWFQNNDLTGQAYRDANYNQISETPWLDEIHPSRQSDEGIPISEIDEIQETSLEGLNNLLEFEHHQHELQDPFPGCCPTAPSPSSRHAESSTNRVATQHWPTISMQEHRLADSSNKATISNDLMKIYHDSLENALECWIDGETCPYRIETDVVGPRFLVVSEQTRSPPVSKTLYSRVYRLDAAFSRQRPRPLTRAEDVGSSKALKLAVMAFACQWSHASRPSSTNVDGTEWAALDHDRIDEPRSRSDFKASGAQDFERLLRLSVWHESQRCIGRWGYCGSFRVILASIVLFCSQQPLDDDESNDFLDSNLEPLFSQNLGAGDSMHSSLGCFGDQLDSSAPSSNTAAQQSLINGVPDLALFSSLLYGHESLQHLEKSLRHLLAWRRSIISSHMHEQKKTIDTTVPEAPYNGNTLPEPQSLSDFNLIFWLGVMADTTSSVLNRRSLIIPDTETFTSFGSVTRLDLDLGTTAAFGASPWKSDAGRSHAPPGRMTQSVDIWGSYLLDADRIWQRSQITVQKLSRSQLNSKTLQQGVPLKMLYWRKVGKLQNMISSHEQQPAVSPTPTEVENAIKEALAVHQYWTVHYREFFAACIREHSKLSFRSQSWYIMLVLGWNMACLILARCIDFVDRNAMSERLGQSLRSSSALTSELKKTSAYAIAEAAWVSSCLPSSSSSLAVGTGTTRSSYSALLSQNAILSDPQTEKVVKALEIASGTLLDWLRQWRSPAADDCVPHLSWLYTNTNSDEISRHCVSCINALDLLKSKSDVARLTTEHLIVRYSRLSVATR